MSQTPPRFSLFVYFYLAAFFLLLGLLPAYLIAHGRLGEPTGWLVAVLWLAILAGLSLYAQSRCSSDRMSFRDGLLWVTASMMTGWIYLSFIIVLPMLLVVFFASIFIAIYGDIRRTPGYSQAKWHHLIHHFYRNRMRQ